jgi:hypothetical protein
LILSGLLVHPSTQNLVPSFSNHNHHIIFNPVGRIAAQMSYIHVAIPVNLISVQQQINAFHGYLNTFTNLSTSHSNKAHLTRVINELATFAKSDIVDFTTRLRMLDHVLPIDNKPHRHKRFIDLILFKVCSNQLDLIKTEFHQCNTTFYKLFNDSAESFTKLNALKTHKIPGLSFITPRQARQNVITTSAVVICELERKSFSRKLQQCLSNTNLTTSFLASCNSNISNLLNHSFTHLATPHFIPITPPPTTTPPPPTTTDFHFYNIPDHISVQTSGTIPINPIIRHRQCLRLSTNHPRPFFSKIEGRSDVVLTTGVKYQPWSKLTTLHRCQYI